MLTLKLACSAAALLLSLHLGLQSSLAIRDARLVLSDDEVLQLDATAFGEEATLDEEEDLDLEGLKARCAEAALFGGKRRAALLLKNKCACADGWTLQGETEVCPYVGQRFYPDWLPAGRCSCRSASASCKAGIFLSEVGQPELGVRRLPVGGEPMPFALFNHSSGCSKEFSLFCLDGLASVKAVLRCPDLNPKVPAELLPGSPGPFVDTWQICRADGRRKVADLENTLTLLQDIIGVTYETNISAGRKVNGCIQLDSPDLVPEYRFMQGSVQEQALALQAAKRLVGGCPLFRDEEARVGRGDDFFKHKNWARDLQKQLTQRAQLLALQGNLWERSMGKKFGDFFHLIFLAAGPPAGNMAVADNLMANLNCGMPMPLVGGPMYFQHSEVVAAASDLTQRRVYSTFTVPQTESCFEPSLLLFLSTGSKEHQQTRQLLDESGFDTLGQEPLLSSMPEKYKGPMQAKGHKSPSETTLAAHVLPMVVAAIWKKEAPARTIKKMLPYMSKGKMCIFGKMVESLGLLAKRKIRRVRRAMLDFAKETPRYASFQHLLNDERYYDTKMLHASTDKSPEDLLATNVGDATLFAGLLGTTNMAWKCVSYQWNSREHVRMYREEKTAYLHELMRYDSAVTSITTAVKENRTAGLTLQGLPMELGAGTPMQMGLAPANWDPKVFREPEVFNPKREDILGMMSWNGRLEDVRDQNYLKAPRFCPGYRLSLKVAIEVCDHYTAQLSSEAA